VVIPTLEQASGLPAGVTFGVATNPEFIREGSSIRDFFDAARTVIGADDKRSEDAVRAVYADLASPIFAVPIRTSELIKYTDNAFHTIKIAFANEVASLATVRHRRPRRDARDGRGRWAEHRSRLANRSFIEQHLPHLQRLLHGTLEDAVTGAKIVVVAKGWDRLAGLPELLRPEQRAVDLVGVDWADQVRGPHAGIGW
jgi:hypothetical protein